MQNIVTSNPDPNQCSGSSVGQSSGQPRPRIAVIGDIMVDVDLHCRCTRICQEGPWPVFSVERTERRLGAAGNVAQMLHVLGAKTLLAGVVGEAGLRDVPLSGLDLALQFADGTTTTKVRLHVQGKLVGPRVDQDLIAPSTSVNVALFLRSLREFQPEAIVVADHGKGVVTRELMSELGELSVPVFVDPIQRTPFPCRVDAVAGGVDELSFEARSADCVVEKRGPGGLAWRCSESRGDLPSICQNLVDPLGAGDQFISVLTWLRCRGADWKSAIEAANLAAGMQCERFGCQPVIPMELDSRLQSMVGDQTYRRSA